MPDPLESFRRYASLIEPMLAPASTLRFIPESESNDTFQVERGIVYAQAMIEPRNIDVAAADKLIDPTKPPNEFAIVDRQGHRRPVYSPLLVYSWLQAFRRCYETLPRDEFGRWDESLRPWCDAIETELSDIDWPVNAPLPAGRGSSLTVAAFGALALYVAGKVFIRDAWTDLAADTFGRISKRQLDDGSFLAASAADNPETRWYHELVALHAAASYAVQAEDRAVASAVARASDFHMREMQPDHATNQPWALFALIWNEPTRPLADQLLHAVSTIDPATTSPSSISLMLLADALYCVRLFL